MIVFPTPSIRLWVHHGIRVGFELDVRLLRTASTVRSPGHLDGGRGGDIVLRFQ